MTQQEYENKIKELEERIEIRNSQIEEPQPKHWKPNIEEKYWEIGVDNFIKYVLGVK